MADNSVAKDDIPKPPKKGWFENFVDKLPQNQLFQFLARHILVPFWAWREPTAKADGGPPPATAPGDNVQHMMNLIMPLKDKSPLGRAAAAMAVGANTDAIYAGLDNVGTVHFARFIIVENNLCMISVYDGDFTNYIRDFIATLGSVFDAILEIVEDTDDVTPTEDNADAFIEWVHERDMFQFPDLPTDMMDLKAVESGKIEEVMLSPEVIREDLRSLSRKVVLQMNANPNISLGSGYRSYPGFSVSEVRKSLGLGW